MAATDTKDRNLSKFEAEKGDVFSESSHYILLGKIIEGLPNTPKYKFRHVESKAEVLLDEKYVMNLLKSGDQYSRTEVVGKEDKYWTKKQIDSMEWANPEDKPKVGDLRQLGIRSIWENIHSEQVFTVCFKKADDPLSEKALRERKEAQIAIAVAEIEAAAKSKKGVAKIARTVINSVMENPILPFIVGEDRILRGYKIQFSSRDGRYNCVDLDLQEDSSGFVIRPVNILTIKWLVFNGVKYVVE